MQTTSQTGNYIAIAGFLAPIISRGLGITVTSDSIIAIGSAALLLYGIIHQYIVVHSTNKAVIATAGAVSR